MDRRTFLASGTATAALAATPAAARALQAPAARPAAGPGDAGLNAIFDEVLKKTIQRSPELATSIGFDKGPGAALKRQLTDRSPAAKARAQAETKDALARIEAVDPATLSEASKLDREIVAYSLKTQLVPRERFDLDAVMRPFAIFQQGGIYFSMPDFLNTAHTISNADDAEALLSRLGQMGQALDYNTQEQDELGKRGVVAPDFCLDLTIEQMQKLRAPAAIDNTIARSLVQRTAAKGIAGDWGARAARIIASGIIPAGLEMMDKPMTAAVEDFVHAGYDLDAAAILLCESDGTPEEVEEEIGRMTEVLRRCGASRLEVSRDEAQRLKFWSGRKNAFPASGRISPDYMCMDSTIPRKRLAEILRAIEAMEQKYGLGCSNVFHAGDGNLHPLILFDANDPDQLHRCEQFGADILETSVRLGGTVTGEHGVGVEKLNSMCVQFSPEERAQMLALKAAFDPAGLLNPGKVIPTLHRCAEYGKMHVSRGLLPFPELERF